MFGSGGAYRGRGGGVSCQGARGVETVAFGLGFRVFAVPCVDVNGGIDFTTGNPNYNQSQPTYLPRMDGF